MGVRELERLYRRHRTIPFPPSHADEEIQEAHDFLIVYDAEVAGLVSRVLEGETEAGEQLKENPELRLRVEKLLERKRGAAELLRQYLENYERLTQMISLAKRVS